MSLIQLLLANDQIQIQYISQPSNNLIASVFEIGGYIIHLTSNEGEIAEINSMGDIHDRTCYQFIICNKTERMMTVLNGIGYTGELVEINLSHVDYNAVIDLDRNGSRWEGGVLYDKPFGWGREISGYDNMVYEGFEYNGQRVCVGQEYCDNATNNIVTFYGYYWNNQRVGHCIFYDLHGDVEFEGKWSNSLNTAMDGMISIIPDVYVMSIFLEDLVIGNHLYNSDVFPTFEISPLFFRLSRIEIGTGCFQKTYRFVISGLEKLERIKIGTTSFKGTGNSDVTGLCHISHCPNLQELIFEDESFCYCKSLVLRKVTSLRSIVFGSYCFWCSDLNLRCISLI